MEENYLHCRTEPIVPEVGRKVALITGITGKHWLWSRSNEVIGKFLTGQDGSYLAEFLLDKGYTVHGIIRRSSSFNTGRISHLYDDPRSHRQGKMILHYGDLIDGNCLVKIMNETKPTEIYNLGAQSHVKVRLDCWLIINYFFIYQRSPLTWLSTPRRWTVLEHSDCLMPSELVDCPTQSGGIQRFAEIVKNLIHFYWILSLNGFILPLICADCQWSPLANQEVLSYQLFIRSRFYQASTSELYGKVQEVPQNEKTPFYPRSPYGVAKLFAYW